MAHVLVTDGNERSALAVARSLRRAGYAVTVMSDSTPSLAGCSSGCREVEAPHPRRNPDEFARRVVELSHGSAFDVVLPVTEAAALAVLPVRDEVEAIIPFVDLEAFERACDKLHVFDVAEGLGIAVPGGRLVSDRDGVAEALGETEYPVVAKPARSVVGQGGTKRRLAVGMAADRDALSALLAAYPDEAFPISLQRRVTGPGVGVFLLPRAGRPLASFAHRRIREKPPSGGVSVLRESIALDPELRALSERLLAALDWDGVAMVEYKLGRDGTPYLMEINPRFWGSLQLAIDAGVDFPRLLVDSALGRPVEPVHEYRVGVRSRWTLGELDHVLMRLSRSNEALDLPPTAPGRLETVRAFLGGFARSREEVFRLDDPRPGLVELGRWFAALGGAG